MSGFEEVHRLHMDLLEVPEATIPFVRSAVEYSANLGKKEWARAAAGAYLGEYPASIDYDMRTPAGFGAMEFQAEIGPNLSRGVGSPGLGITEDSPGGVEGAPRRKYLIAESAIEKDLPQGIEKAVFDGLRAKGLG